MTRRPPRSTRTDSLFPSTPLCRAPAADRTAELEAEIARLKDQILRAMAETENIRKRGERLVEDAHRYAVTGFARDILSVADNLDRAVEAIPAARRSEEHTSALQSLMRISSAVFCLKNKNTTT